MSNFDLKAFIIRKYGRQVDFSRVVQIGENRISKIIHGRAVPTEHEKAVISEKLGIPASELFGCEG